MYSDSYIVIGNTLLGNGKMAFPNRIKSDDGTRQLIQSEVNQLGPLSTAEKEYSSFSSSRPCCGYCERLLMMRKTGLNWMIQ